MNNYYTYLYLDPRKNGNYKYYHDDEIFIFNNEPFYIGKGKNNRDKHHLYLANNENTHNKYLTSKIKKILKTNQSPIIFRFKDKVNETEALNYEKKLIKSIGRKDLGLGPLCNHTDGGESNSNKIITLKARTHKGVFKKGQIPWNKNLKGYKIHTQETKQNTSLRFKNKKRSEQEKLKISRSHNGKSILQYDLNGNFIKEWLTGRDCINNGFKSVVTALHQNRNFANGYLWFKKQNNNYPLIVDKYKPTRYSPNKYKKYDT